MSSAPPAASSSVGSDLARLRELERLTPEEAWRYKILSSARIGPDIIGDLLRAAHGPSASGIQEDRFERVCVALSAASKSFAIELVEEAVSIAASTPSDAHISAPAASSAPPIDPGHLIEAYRRLLAAGRMPAASVPPLDARAFTAAPITPPSEPELEPEPTPSVTATVVAPTGAK